MASVQNGSGLGSMAIYTLRAGSTLGSMAIHTLREGSITERIVLGAAFLATGTYVAYKICQVVSSFFKASQRGEPLSINPGLNPEQLNALEDKIEKKYFRVPDVAPTPKSEKLKEPDPKLPDRSLLESLTLDGKAVTEGMEVPLARALHAYQALKQELKADNIPGDEDLFIFLAERFVQNKDGLRSVVRWEEKNLELKMAPHYHDTFAELEEHLLSVGLSLNNLIRPEKSFAAAKFKDETSKEIPNLADLYQIVKLYAPHILGRFEIELKKKEGEKVKIQIQESRMVIIDRMLSTLKVVLIDDFVESFGEKNKTLYTIVGSNRETLNFVLENICWHALDRVFETGETTVIPSKEAEQKTRKLVLEAHLGKVLKDEAKRKAAQSCLLKILEKPDNNEAMGALVKLLTAEEPSSERDSLIKKLQAPELQSQEESVEQELGRLRGVQRFYQKVKIATAVADEGKDALRQGNGDKNNKGKNTVRQIPSAAKSTGLVENNLFTYAKQIDKLSHEIVEAGSAAVGEVADMKWNESLRSLDEELKKVPNLLPEELCTAIVEKGWVKFDRNRRNELLPLTGEHRWLITKKMIVQRLAKETLQQKGKELLEEVGKRGAYFFNTMYGRFVTAFLAFDQRTRWASGEKPADCIAETFFESVLKCHQALGRVKIDRPKDGGNREDSVVKKLEENGGVHINAVNTPGADAVFLGHLTLQLLSVLQPGGIAEDIRGALNKSWVNPGEAEPTLIQDMIKKYKESIRPAVEPWVKPGGDFLMYILQYIIEKQSIVNFASQLSDLLDPVNLNASLVDFLKDDKSEIIFEPESTGRKERVKWYRADEKFLRDQLNICTELDADVKAMEKSFEKNKTVSSSESLKKFTEELKSKKIKLADLNKRLVPELLRRLAIAAEVPSGLIGYVMQFADDLFELMQYPRVLRHIVFNVLDKSVHSLAKPLEENDKELLQEPVNAVENQSVFDFFFSGPLKTSIGDKILTLFSSMGATENQSSLWVWLAQKVTKLVTPLVSPGHYVFSLIQEQIEKLIKNKFKSDEDVNKSDEAVNWSARKVVVTLNNWILEFAKDPSGKGMTAAIASRLRNLIGFKEEEKKESVPSATFINPTTPNTGMAHRAVSSSEPNVKIMKEPAQLEKSEKSPVKEKKKESVSSKKEETVLLQEKKKTEPEKSYEIPQLSDDDDDEFEEAKTSDDGLDGSVVIVN